MWLFVILSSDNRALALPLQQMKIGFPRGNSKAFDPAALFSRVINEDLASPADCLGL